MWLFIRNDLYKWKFGCARIRNLHKSYYEVLRVKPNSTKKEIRNAFIKLSKELHPDSKSAKKDPKSTATFIDVMEAYRVLSSDESRALYDFNINNRRIHGNYANRIKNEFATHYTNVSSNPKAYYGITGIKKVSNVKIAAILVVIAIVGCSFQFYAVRNSVTLRRDQLNDVSKEAGMQHASVRADAEKYGNDAQLKRLADRMMLNKHDR